MSNYCCLSAGIEQGSCGSEWTMCIWWWSVIPTQGSRNTQWEWASHMCLCFSQSFPALFLPEHHKRTEMFNCLSLAGQICAGKSVWSCIIPLNCHKQCLTLLCCAAWFCAFILCCSWHLRWFSAMCRWLTTMMETKPEAPDFSRRQRELGHKVGRVVWS